VRALWWLVALGALGALWWLASPVGSVLPVPGLLRQPLPERSASLLVCLLLGYALSRASGRPTLGLVLGAWAGALAEGYRAFVPGLEAGIGHWWWALAGAWLGSRLASRSVRRPGAEEPEATLKAG